MSVSSSLVFPTARVKPGKNALRRCVAVRGCVPGEFSSCVHAYVRPVPNDPTE